MNVAEIAAQIGVAPETLVQEVIAQGTTKAVVWVALGTLVTIVLIVSLILGVVRDDQDWWVLLATVALIIGAVMLLTNAPNLIAWKTAPQTTANRYIVEHYGGGQK